MPFFFPVVAGVGLLGPIAAVGFYELARRRERASERPLVQLPRCPQAPVGRRHGHRCRPAARDLLRLAARRRRALCLLFGWATPTSIRDFLAMVFTTPRGWALIVARRGRRRDLRLVVLALSVVSLPMLVDCDISAAEAVSASWRAAHANKARDDPLGPDRRGPAGARLDPAVRRPCLRPAVARLLDLAPLHASGRPERDLQAARA